MKKILNCLLVLTVSIVLAQMRWNCITNIAPWSARAGHAVVVLRDTIWLFGGIDDENRCCNDVWYSPDGASWTCVTSSAPWMPRAYCAAVVLRDTIWLMGGWNIDYPPSFRDVWYSPDGRNWRCALDSAPWIERNSCAAVVLRDTIWLMGGNWPINFSFRDVWYSPDGRNWRCALDSAPWIGRYDAAAVVLRDTIWLMGGDKGTQWLKDVWYTRDGFQWFCATDSAPWSWLGRTGHAVVVLRDTIWLMGGYYRHSQGANTSNDVWYSPDGASWTCVTSSAPWMPRAYFAAVVLRDTIWLMGGYTGPQRLKDVWCSPGLNGGAIEETQPVTQPIVLTSTILRSISELTLTEPIILLDPTGRKVADLRPGTNNIRHIQRGIYFLIPNTPAKLSRKIILIK